MKSLLLEWNFFITTFLCKLLISNSFSVTNSNNVLINGHSKKTNSHNIQKRQVLINDLLNTALQLVRPIFDTSQVLSYDNSMIPKRIMSESSSRNRESTILGAPMYTSLREVPICRANSQICKFISCTAHNFKYDQNFSNLNLAAQLIGDEELRKTLTNNPETVITVCHEQGLSKDQCQMFVRAFQLIDRVMTSVKKSQIIDATENYKIKKETYSDAIEEKNFNHNFLDINEAALDDAIDEETMSLKKIIPSTFSTLIQPIQPINQRKIFSSTTKTLTKQKKNYVGSRTWSTHNNNQFKSDENLFKKVKENILSTEIRVVSYDQSNDDNYNSFFLNETSLLKNVKKKFPPKASVPKYLTVKLENQTKKLNNGKSFETNNKQQKNLKSHRINSSLTFLPENSLENDVTENNISEIPEAEVDYDDLDYNKNKKIFFKKYLKNKNNRKKRSNDYYDNIEDNSSDLTEHSNIIKEQNYERKIKNNQKHKINCLQYLG